MSSINIKSSLKTFLETTRLVSRAEADELWQESKGDEIVFAKLLLEHGKLTEADLQRACGHVWGLSVVDLTTRKLKAEVLQMIPEPFARSHNVIAYELTDQGLEVALMDPVVVEKLASFLTPGVKIVPRLTTSASIKYGLKEYHKVLQQQFGDQISQVVREITAGNRAGLPSKLLELLLAHAKASKTSVVYLEPSEQDLLVRYRLAGRLYDAMVLPVSVLEPLTHVISNQFDGNFSSIRTVFGERIVITLNSCEVEQSLESLGMSSGAIEQVQAILERDRGLILIGGQSSTGKSTLGYTLLESLALTERSVVTVEDTITQRLRRVNQTVVASNLGLSTASSLRAVCRHIPDVVMVDEIKDSETASLALNLGLAQSLIIGVLKSRSAIDGISKFNDLVSSAQACTSGLKLAITSALVRRLGEERKQYFLTSVEVGNLTDQFNLDLVLETLKLEKIVEANATWTTIPFYKPSSSEERGGYDGNIGVYEVLPVSSSIKDMLIGGNSEKELRVEVKRLGYLTLADEGLILAVRGLTTIDEVLRTL